MGEAEEVSLHLRKASGRLLSDTRELTPESPAPTAQDYRQSHTEACPLPHDIVFKIPVQCPIFLPEQALVPTGGPIESKTEAQGFFKKYWLASILLTVFQFGFVWCFLMIRLRLCIFGKNAQVVFLHRSEDVPSAQHSLSVSRS